MTSCTAAAIVSLLAHLPCVRRMACYLMFVVASFYTHVVFSCTFVWCAAASTVCCGCQHSVLWQHCLGPVPRLAGRVSTVAMHAAVLNGYTCNVVLCSCMHTASSSRRAVLKPVTEALRALCGSPAPVIGISGVSLPLRYPKHDSVSAFTELRDQISELKKQLSDAQAAQTTALAASCSSNSSS